MTNFLKQYYDTEGPFGLPMRDQQARDLETLLKQLPREKSFEPQKALVEKAPSELLWGERADISWISEESIDRQGDIVLAAGMDDTHFRLNPLVTMNHAYWLPPVGTSQWRRQATDGTLRGIKAKTHYQPRPDSWPADADWPADIAFALVQSGLLRGKSVGFLPLKMRRPAQEEIAQDPALAKVRFIVEKWMLLEYACVYLPAQQNAVVESVSKCLPLAPEFAKAAHLFPDLSPGPASPVAPAVPPRVVPFTPAAEIEKALHRRLAALDLPALVQQAVHDGWHRLRGGV
jgi:hypothetical protein